MSRKKVLWLVSWYPNDKDRFDGDFIQRHARAAAIYHDVHLIFVTPSGIGQPAEEKLHYVRGLTEQVIYFKKNKGFFFKLQHQYKWKQLFIKAIENYVSKDGLPSCVHVHIPWKAGLIALWIKKRYNLPFILSEHWSIYDEKEKGYIGNWPVIFQKMMKQVYQSASKLVSVSRYLAEHLEKTMGRKMDAIIPNVVDTSLFYLKEDKYSVFTFIHVSNMAPVKNVKEILEAFQLLVQKANHTQVQLLMIGNRNDEFRQMASQMGFDRNQVIFMGEIPYADVAASMRKSHCLVLFSSSETFSCVTAEALCCGIPVITSQVGALPELVDHTNGILVQPKEVWALTQAMMAIRSGEVQFNTSQIAAKAASSFGYSRVSKDFLELYNTMGVSSDQ